MATSTAVAGVYAMTILGLSLTVMATYFIIVFSILFIAGWALVRFLKPVYKFLEHD